MTILREISIDFIEAEVTLTGTLSTIPIACQSFSDVYICKFNPGIPMASGQGAVKRYRITDINKRLFGEDLAERQLTHDIFFAAKLKHPNVAETFGHAFCPDGSPAIVMGWHEQGPAAEYLARYPTTSKTKILLDVIKGREYLHVNGVVHGDIRGDSILVDDDGNAVLAGLGQAELLGAPEVIVNNMRRTFPSDIWALGCTLFELLTGRKPYSGYRAVRVPVLMAQGIMPGRFGGDETDEVEQWRPIIEACWMSDPAQRPDIRILKQMVMDSLPEH
ncbi:kinase-like protein [Neolentinus lepideus HHB14362 ss-1]|uniref:Kinase-like protein n=1 Tax=Neolentinus lepideus HHB14362 ss-1 TaxID=1314782 RepID=A0A165PWF6_9AGAM|nr:kinase-like protein [Neolentinus lepideus HHB14362 ss-1]